MKLRANIYRNEMYSKLKIKNSLRGLAFNLINIDDTQIYKDFNKVINHSFYAVNLSLVWNHLILKYYLILKTILIL